MNDVMNKFLIYRNSKGETSAFEVEPKYIKGNNFAAKNLENGRQKSFSMNLTIGLFDTQKEVDSTLKTIESNKIATAKLEAQLEAQRERLTTKVEELRAKAQKLRCESVSPCRCIATDQMLLSLCAVAPMRSSPSGKIVSEFQTSDARPSCELQHLVSSEKRCCNKW